MPRKTPINLSKDMAGFKLKKEHAKKDARTAKRVEIDNHKEELKGFTRSELHAESNRISLAIIDIYPDSFKKVLGKHRRIEAIKELLKETK